MKSCNFWTGRLIFFILRYFAYNMMYYRISKNENNLFFGKKNRPGVGSDLKWERGNGVSFFIIYQQWNTPDTTLFPTQKYKFLYHATNVIFFRITILHVLPNSQDKSQHLAANS